MALIVFLILAIAFAWVIVMILKAVRRAELGQRRVRQERRVTSAPRDDRFNDVSRGQRFKATFNLKTPLSVLENHNLFSPKGQPLPEVMPGPGSAEDPFGAYGIWIHEADWEGLSDKYGIDLKPEKSKVGVSTELGMMDPDSREYQDFFEFLKGFRRIIESTDDVMESLDQLQRLSNETSGNQRIWDLYLDASPDFPMPFLVEQFKLKIGASKGHAKALIEAGYTSVNKVRNASDGELQNVKGIGAVTVKRIRERLEKPCENSGFD